LIRNFLHSNLKKVHNKFKPKQKHHLLRQIRNSDFSYEEAKKMGFEASSHLWKSCRDENERNPGKNIEN